jgi:hypothetical protein
MIHFRFNPTKAFQAIEWMLATANTPLDFHTILKAVYFADKEMLNLHGKPIFGASYRAMNYGPVPLEIYEMLKCEPYWLTELSIDDYPWIRSGYKISKDNSNNHLPDTVDIAPAELEILEKSFKRSRTMNFNQRTRETHGMDWVEGTRRSGGEMAYEDMIELDRPNRAELIEELETMGPRLVL